jgi:hypothetical protein
MLIINILLISFIACDPVHGIYLVNKSPNIIVIQVERKAKFDTLNVEQSILIGKCVAHYEPRINDIELNYLKIISKTDTIELLDKNSIFARVKKIKSLKWRLIYE